MRIVLAFGTSLTISNDHVDTIIDNNHLKTHGNWMAISNLNIPSKFKHFLWRLLRECLPTRHRLIHKGVNCSRECVFCSSNPENYWLLFFDFPTAKLFLQAAGLWTQTEEKICTVADTNDLIFSLLQQLAPDISANSSRNEKLWKEVDIAPHIFIALSNQKYSERLYQVAEGRSS